MLVLSLLLAVKPFVHSVTLGHMLISLLNHLACCVLVVHMLTKQVAPFALNALLVHLLLLSAPRAVSLAPSALRNLKKVKLPVLPALLVTTNLNLVKLLVYLAWLVPSLLVKAKVFA